MDVHMQFRKHSCNVFHTRQLILYKSGFSLLCGTLLYAHQWCKHCMCFGFVFNQFLILADQYKESVLSDQLYFL